MAFLYKIQLLQKRVDRLERILEKAGLSDKEDDTETTETKTEPPSKQ